MAAVVGPPSVEPPNYVQPFDVRIAGICTEGDIKRNVQLEDALKYLSRQKMTVSTLGKEQVRLTWAEIGVESTIDFDESIGYLPLRYEIRYTIASKKDQPPFSVCTVAWKRINGIFVPERMITSYGTKPDPVTTYEYNFVWDHVNKPVPKEIFTVEGMSLPEGLLIVSNETGQTVTLGKVGDKEFPPPLIDSSVFGNVPFYMRWWFILTVVGAILAVLAGALWLRRKFAAQP
jgi:hypothetical protein